MSVQVDIANNGFFSHWMQGSLLVAQCKPRQLVAGRILAFQDRVLSFASVLMASGSSVANTDAEDDTQPTPATQAAPSVRPEAKTVNILVVEDEGIVALHIKMTLKRLGHHVIATVDTGKDAITLALEMHPDLILMDVRLKGDIDGIEAVQTIQQRRAVPVIYLTGQLDEGTVNRAQPTKPLGYLAKPFTVSELSALIQQVVERKAAGHHS